ncbi:Histone-lysine N-methyltransferase SETMAR [Eumeta japonica]|uniref:Histone-lysine N-methyltransferase SETMAR n=1 Tax=Eumeta variegata TaxID=151549 RepID=A0A4C1ZPV6_EUMVA|nr:Histone-lysine N-methyltransferase SETMAR [Eumeta japonica]
MKYVDRGADVTGSLYAQQIKKCIRKFEKNGEANQHKIFCSLKIMPHLTGPPLILAAIRDADFEILDHPPYTPDLATSDFRLFPKLKEYLKG